MSVFRFMQRTLDLDGVLSAPEAFERALRAVPFFYYVLLFYSFVILEGLNHMVATGPGPGFSLRWPLFWAEGLSFPVLASFLTVLLVVSSLAGAFAPRLRVFRIIAFLGVLEYHALRSSFGPFHQLDLWLWVSFLLVFLPDFSEKSPGKEVAKKFLVVFWSVQAFILLTFSLSGFGKLYGGVSQALSGEASIFSSDAAALHISTLLHNMGETTVLGPLLVEFQYAGWLLFLGVLYIQLFSVVAAFRPRIHRLWGLALILFQLGTFLAMRAIFVAPVAMIALFLLASPFSQPSSVRQTLCDLPLFGFVLSRVWRRPHFPKTHERSL